MKRILSMIAFLTISLAGFAQDVDNFEVGPYEVDYKGAGDYKFRLRKGVDLYDYFGLAKDTTIVMQQEDNHPVASAWNLSLQLAVPGHGITGCSNKFGIITGYKQLIATNLYLNANISAALSFGKYAEEWDYMKETLLEAGIPISLEFANLKENKASLYGSIGITPTFFSSLSNKTSDGVDIYESTNISKSGFYIAPVLGIGGYVPTGGRQIRLGCFAQYNINFKNTEEDVFAQRIGRFVVGFELGILL